ncbi:unnamed protein product [Dibothriocephalus latus]|uniref:Uncharacterized protein n=1 Tax=Dibothriocephalus latus TaxID=60516 RepID=A0A3P6UEC1_DIBLA|nr:unnamed protein product [Dibothriocephalus latus]
MHTYGQVKFEEIYKECRLRYIRQTCRLKKIICWTPEGDLVLLNPRKVRRGSPYLTGAGKADDKQNSLECDFEKCASAPRIADLISSSTLSRFQQAMQNSVQKCTFPTSSSFPQTASSRGYARELVLMRKHALMSPASNKTLTTVENIAPVPTPKLNAMETTGA